MKKRYSLMIGAATALGAGLGTEVGFTALESNLNQGTPSLEQVMETCAPLLGDAAMTAAKLPEGCEDAAGYIPYRASIVEDVDYKNPPTLYDSGVTVVTEHRMYSVPTRNEFEQTMKPLVEKEQERHGFAQKLAGGLAVVMGLGLGWSAYAFSSRSREKTKFAVQNEGEL